MTNGIVAQFSFSLGTDKKVIAKKLNLACPWNGDFGLKFSCSKKGLEVSALVNGHWSSPCLLKISNQKSAVGHSGVNSMPDILEFLIFLTVFTTSLKASIPHVSGQKKFE